MGGCDGLGTTCELKTANYTKNHRRYGIVYTFGGGGGREGQIRGRIDNQKYRQSNV